MQTDYLIFDELRDLQANAHRFMKYGRTCYSAELDRKCTELYEAGVSQFAIAIELGISRVQICKRIKRQRRRAVEGVQ